MLLDIEYVLPLWNSKRIEGREFWVNVFLSNILNYNYRASPDMVDIVRLTHQLGSKSDDQLRLQLRVANITQSSLRQCVFSTLKSINFVNSLVDLLTMLFSRIGGRELRLLCKTFKLQAGKRHKVASKLLIAVNKLCKMDGSGS